MATIYALASARGKAGVAVVRVSGPQAHEILERLAGPVPASRRTYLRRLTHADGFLDEALVVKFDAGASFTGEPVAELHLHGGTATVTAVLRTLADQPGLRLAEPGEFTRRALENGLLDLTQVEGLADLVDAETEGQRQQALRVLSGAVGAKAAVWRRDIIRAAALVEASIDFADEDLPVDVMPEVGLLVASLLGSLRAEIRLGNAAERIRDGFEVAIVGAPNVGKSTLLNALAGRDAAITSATAGTTRDVIEVRMDLGGLAITLLDTAGIRETTDEVERIGVERARIRAEAADLRILLVADDALSSMKPLDDDIVVHSKSDLLQGSGLRVSGKTGEGLATLTGRITGILQERASRAGTLIRERHRIAVARTISALESAQDALQADVVRPELIAEELMGSAKALDTLIGRVGNEHLLDEIFSSFCIGK